MHIDSLFDALKGAPELLSLLQLHDIITFLDVVCRLKDDIAAVQSPFERGPPLHLPVPIHNFLMAAFSLPDEMVKVLWNSLRQVAWDYCETQPKEDEAQRRQAEKLAELFLRYGIPHGVCE